MVSGVIPAQAQSYPSKLGLIELARKQPGKLTYGTTVAFHCQPPRSA